MMNNNLWRKYIILSHQPVEIRCQLHRISIINLKHLFVAVEPGSPERCTNRSKILLCCMAMDPREKHMKGLTGGINQEGVRSMFFHIITALGQSHRAWKMVSSSLLHLSQVGEGTQYLLYSTIFEAKDPLHIDRVWNFKEGTYFSLKKVLRFCLFKENWNRESD